MFTRFAESDSSVFTCIGALGTPAERGPSLSGVGTMGKGGYIVPPSSGLIPPVPPQVKDAAYVKILSKRL